MTWVLKDGCGSESCTQSWGVGRLDHAAGREGPEAQEWKACSQGRMFSRRGIGGLLGCWKRWATCW